MGTLARSMSGNRPGTGQKYPKTPVMQNQPTPPGSGRPGTGQSKKSSGSNIKKIKITKPEEQKLDPGDKSLQKEDIVFSQLTERTSTVSNQKDIKSLKVDYLEREIKHQNQQIEYLNKMIVAYKKKV